MARKILDAEGSADVEAKLNNTVGEYCRSTNASPRDQYLHAHYVLEFGSASKRYEPTECQLAYHTTGRLRAAGTPTPAYRPDGWVRKAAACAARAGDCAMAMKLFDDITETSPDEARKNFPEALRMYRIACAP